MGNVKQVGGDHYSAEYQHWDWCADTGMPYLEGTASKYLTRWKKKGGNLDLEKALSYVNKAIATAGRRPDPLAGERRGRDLVKLHRFLASSGLLGTVEGELITELDGCRSLGTLRHVAQVLVEMIHESA